MQKIIDLHCDTIAEIQAGADIQKGNPAGHIDIQRLKNGGIGCQIFACFISSVFPEEKAHSEVIDLLRLIDETCTNYDSDLVKVETATQIMATPDQKIAILPAVENGHAIANDLAKLEKLRWMGTRYMTLTHSKNLMWAASSGESECEFEGLTPFGEKVIAAMNEMGIIVDVSHVHETTFWDSIRLSKRPIIASHSNALALCPTNRNLTDDQIKAIADSGGMIGLNFYPGFLDAKYEKEQNARCGDLFNMLNEIEKNLWHDPCKKIEAMYHLGDELQNRMADISVGCERIIDHMLYIIDLAGDEFVGFGSDFDGVPALPYGMSGCDIYPLLIDLMKENGLSDMSIENICRKNFIRVLNEHDI